VGQAARRKGEGRLSCVRTFAHLLRTRASPPTLVSPRLHACAVGDTACARGQWQRTQHKMRGAVRVRGCALQTCHSECTALCFASPSVCVKCVRVWPCGVWRNMLMQTSLAGQSAPSKYPPLIILFAIVVSFENQFSILGTHREWGISASREAKKRGRSRRRPRAP
jgi:hypothetical protein